MKKSLALVLAAASILTVSSSAFAVNTLQQWNGTVNGQFAGRVLFVPRNINVPGPIAAPFCQYDMIWRDAFNPNEASLCRLNEWITAQVPACNIARFVNFETALTNDEGVCAIRDGLSLQNLACLTLGEAPDGGGIHGVGLLSAFPIAVSVTLTKV
jgi:hypothetical protein